MHDVLNADGRFLSFDEFKNKFNIKTNYLYYFQLIAAIPPDLKRRAAQNIVPSRDFLSTTATFRNEISINLAEMRYKNYYTELFYGNCFIDPSGIRNWQKKFREDFVTWKSFVTYTDSLEITGCGSLPSASYIESLSPKRTELFPYSL